MNDACVFCSIAAGNREHHEVVWEDAGHIAFLSKGPVARAHLLVIPKAHIDYVFDLSKEAYGALMEAVRTLAGPLKSYAGTKRVALAVDGFQVPHVHVHLIPVNHSGELANPPLEPSPAALAEIGGDLRKVYASLL